MPRAYPLALLPFLAILLAGAAPVRASAGFDDGQLAKIEHPAWLKEGFLNLEDDLAEARAAGKVGLLVFFSTDGCSYCRLFIRESLSNPQIAARVQAHFDTIGLEIFDDAELTDLAGRPTRVKQFALDQGVQFAPTLLFYDGTGRLALRLTGYYEPERFSRALDFVIGGHYERTTLRDWLAQAASETPQARQAPPAEPWGLADDPLFAPPPYALERRRIPAERPLLAIFERADCPRCARFHAEVLGDPGLRALLAGLEVVRLDAADTLTPVLTPDGRRTDPADWARSLGFEDYPALAFFSEDGREVLKTDALVLKSRMGNSLGFVLERAYEQGWTYQRFARSRAAARAAAGAQ
jgi:thioredoxin-related protein